MTRSPTPLTPDQLARLAGYQKRAASREASADKARQEFKAAVLVVLAEGGSYREISRATEISTATIQRWKIEALAEALASDSTATGLWLGRKP